MFIRVSLLLLLLGSVTGLVEQTSHQQPLTLFLIGKTGHGKSSCGNSLLGREAFQVSDGAESETNRIQRATGSCHGRTLHVIDGPGALDTRLDTAADIRTTIRDIEDGIARSAKGIDAFVLVLKYGNRFTEEEKVAIDSLKSILGANFLRDYGIILFTHGELFDTASGGLSVGFDTWLFRQSGALGSLIEEVDHRCSLAYNLDTDRMDFPALFAQMDEVEQKSGRPYTLDTFLQMGHLHEQLIARADALRLKQEIDTEITCKTDQLKSLDRSWEGHEPQRTVLAALKDDVIDLKERIKMADQSTGVLAAQRETGDWLLMEVERMERELWGDDDEDNDADDDGWRDRLDDDDWGD